jgi:hypothetical protein
MARLAARIHSGRKDLQGTLAVTTPTFALCNARESDPGFLSVQRTAQSDVERSDANIMTALFWVSAGLLISTNAISLFLNLLLLPGNWLMVGASVLWVLATDFDRGPTWTIVIVSLALATTGELFESFLGSAQAARKGASRRAMVLSLVLSIAGSIVGTFLIPIPVVGSVLGAILGAAVGAFSGAWLGEAWIGTEMAKRSEIGSAAMSGRLWGMLVKFAFGAAICAVQVVSLF